MKKVLFLGLFLFLSSAMCIAQSASDKAKSELEKRGLRDDEVRARLLEKGYDIDNIDINNPAEIFKLEQSMKEVIAEIEKEKIASSNNGGGSSSTLVKPKTDEQAKILAKESEEIAEAIDEGATLEEAVSEELIDAQEDQLPPATMYGQEVFRSQNIKLYRKSQDVKPPASYVLGVGDIVAVSIWGYSEEDLIFEINGDGYIKPQGIPRIYLKGIRLGNAKKLLLDRFANYYKFNDNEFEVALSFGRTINVNITGEVYNYGNFNLPAINTAFNALVAAGGPNNIGSVRNIKLKRYGQEDKNIDIYKYLQDPSYSMDFFLEEEDILHIPIAEKIVQITGAILRPNRYELKSAEDLVELLQFCGGLKANASLQNIQITRFENNEEIIIDVNLNDVVKSNQDFKLQNGDIVQVFEIAGAIENFATISGAVSMPGKYALGKSTKVSDLLERTTLEDHAFLDIAYLKRENKDNKTTYSYFRLPIGAIAADKNHPENIELENGDQLVIYSKSKFLDAESFTISGHVRDPGEISYDFSNKLKISDALVMAGGLKKFATDFAYIQRPSTEDPNELNYLRVNIKDVSENAASLENIEILPGDKIVAYSKEAFEEKETITIRGLVNKPGSFAYDPSLSIQDLLDMSGGLSKKASKKRIDVYRLDVSDDRATKTLAANLILDENNKVINGNFELQPDDLIIFRQAAEYEDLRTVQIIGEVVYPGVYAIIDGNEKISSIIERAGGLTDQAFVPGMIVERFQNEIGRISLNAEEKRFRNSEQNIIVKNNDVIVVPKMNDLVTIYGVTSLAEDLNTSNRIVVPFVKNKSAMEYIESYAGGVSERLGDKRRIRVKYPDGHFQTPKRRFLFFWKYPSIEPGCQIEVPGKVEKNLGEGGKTDWGDILQQTVTQATALLTLLLLIQRVD